MNDDTFNADTVNNNPSMIEAIRLLVSQYSLPELQNCEQDQVNCGNNLCITDIALAADAKLNILSKASFVKKLMSEGRSSRDALRELGRRMRLIQGR